MEFFVKALAAKYALAAPKLDEGGEYAKSFSEIRSGLSRGSRSSCLGAQGKSAEIRK
jgi:hypothetical protein